MKEKLTLLIVVALVLVLGFPVFSSFHESSIGTKSTDSVDIQIVHEDLSNFEVNPGDNYGAMISCPANQKLVSGTCKIFDASQKVILSASSPIVDDTWKCMFRSDATEKTISAGRAEAHCVPTNS